MPTMLRIGLISDTHNLIVNGSSVSARTVEFVGQNAG